MYIKKRGVLADVIQERSAWDRRRNYRATLGKNSFLHFLHVDTLSQQCHYWERKRTKEGMGDGSESVSEMPR
jgi:hypothetical protein